MRVSKNEWLAVLLAVGMMGCDKTSPDSSKGADPSSSADGALAFLRSDGGTSDGSKVTDPNACETVSNGVELQPVHLAFAFDISGSMGSGDEPWYNKALKWDPVVSATRSFFAADSSKGLSASLTFFPAKGTRSICDADEYETPDVPMTALPSPAFSAAIEVITPKSKDDWGQGTPTLAVMRGSSTFVKAYRAQHEGRYAVVLVTDGYPQGCSGQNDINQVAAQAASALASEQQTYVIGVANPKLPGAPDTVTNLHKIAAAGGTDKAVLIDTGDPTATAAAFSSAIDKIRKAAISCSVVIPEARAGAAFDKRSVAVHYLSGNKSVELVYDKSCASPNAWHYDNVDDPKRIELCDATCNLVRADASAELIVDFACEPLILI